jgi:hypothetical protein
MTKRVVQCAVALVLLLASATLTYGQQVEIRGRGDIRNDGWLRDLVRSGDYVLMARDTLLTASDTVQGTALVLGASVRIDGVVTGDLVIVDANVFLRPNARILGDVRNLGGGFYPADQAVVSGTVFYEPLAEYMVVEEDDGARLVIVGTSSSSNLVLPGIFGFSIPTYDRVDGLTLSFGAGLLTPRIGRLEPEVRGRVDYRSLRSAITGGVEVELPRGGTSLTLGAERTTLTNERWIRGDFENSVSFLVLGKDLRDYYEADRAYAELRRRLESGPRTTTVYLRGVVEEATSLTAGSPWTLFGTPRPENLPVAESRISSVMLGGSMVWDHLSHQVRIDAATEAAGTFLDGEHTFNHYIINADWAMHAFANHTLRIQPHLQGPLPGTDSLPQQRWSFVGGSGTLNTFDDAEFRGDRVVFVETQYIIPLPIQIRVVGAPDLELLHQAGMAWTHDDATRGLEQNVGVRLRLSLVNVRVMMNPSATGDQPRFNLSAGVNMPRRAYPWERNNPRE